MSWDQCRQATSRADPAGHPPAAGQGRGGRHRGYPRWDPACRGHPAPGPTGAIQVITLATGATRTWTTSDSGTPEDLSWDAAGRRLGFFWSSDSASRAGLWLLDTGAPGSALLSGRRLVPQTVGPDQVQDALLSPDAQTIIASVTYNTTAHVGRGAVVGGRGVVRADRPAATDPARRACRPFGGRGMVHHQLPAAIHRHDRQPPAGQL